MAKKHLLLIIDSQKGIDNHEHWGGNRNNPDAEENIAKILSVFRKLQLPIIHIQHCSKEPNSPLRSNQTGHDFKSCSLPINEEQIIQKNATSAFVNTNLQVEISKLNPEYLVVVGFVTNNSVEATVRNAGDLGFNTIVVSDATATFNKIGLNNEVYDAELMHAISLANMSPEYAAVLNTENLLKKLQQSQ